MNRRKGGHPERAAAEDQAEQRGRATSGTTRRTSTTGMTVAATVGGACVRGLNAQRATTLVGFVIGVVAAVACACGASASRLVAATVMPSCWSCGSSRWWRWPRCSAWSSAAARSGGHLTAIIVFVPSMVSLSQAMRDVPRA